MHNKQINNRDVVNNDQKTKRLIFLSVALFFDRFYERQISFNNLN